MRLDVWLKESRLIKRRSIANDACDRGLVLLNGSAARAGKEVRVSPSLTVMFRHRILTLKIDSLPQRKPGGAPCFTVIADEPSEAS